MKEEFPSKKNTELNNKTSKNSDSLKNPEFLDRYYSLMSKLMNIDIEEEWENNVKFHISNAAKMAEIIENCPLDENTIDLSNTFHPGKE